MPEKFESPRGSALIVVLLTVGFVSFVSVLFVQYTRWQSNLGNIPKETLAADEAIEYGRSKVHSYFRKNLSDTGYVSGTIRKRWELQPDIVIEASIYPLNAKLNLNTLVQSQKSSSVSILTAAFDSMNYPSRTIDELEQWMGEDETTAAQYAGMGYRAPERPIYHLDELSLVSGFIQIGVSDQLRNLFTVYGTGRFNPLHLTPRRWQFLKRVTNMKLPQLPDRALRNSVAFRNFIRRDAVWSKIKDNYSFMTKRDDSFRVEYRIRSGSVERIQREIYVYNYLTDTLKIESSYPIFSWDRQES